MNYFTMMLGAAALLAAALATGSAFAATEGEMIRMHDACRAGDHAACEHFGAALHAEHAHEGEWRHHHPEWYR